MQLLERPAVLACDGLMFVSSQCVAVLPLRWLHSCSQVLSRLSVLVKLACVFAWLERISACGEISIDENAVRWMIRVCGVRGSHGLVFYRYLYAVSLFDFVPVCWLSE